MSKVLAVFGLISAAASVAFGFMPVHADGFGCGSVFSADDNAVRGARLYNQIVGASLPHKVVPDCDGARSSRLVLTAVFGVAGLGCLVAAGATRERSVEPPAAAVG